VAFALYRRAARYVRGLILADTRPQADTDEARVGRRKMQKLVEENGAGAVADQMLPKLLADPGSTETATWIRKMIEDISPQGIKHALTALMSRPDSTDLLPKIGEPTAILVGELDAVTPVSDSEAMHEQIRGSTLTVVPGAAHLSSVEQPAAFNAAVSRFLVQRF